jgi:hypothetical protein
MKSCMQQMEINLAGGGWSRNQLRWDLRYVHIMYVLWL